jgi:hypothetical protein
MMIGGGEGGCPKPTGDGGAEEQGVGVAEIHVAERWKEDIGGALSELSGPKIGERARAASRLLGVRGVMGRTVVILFRFVDDGVLTKTRYVSLMIWCSVIPEKEVGTKDKIPRRVAYCWGCERICMSA